MLHGSDGHLPEEGMQMYVKVTRVGDEALPSLSYTLSLSPPL